LLSLSVRATELTVIAIGSGEAVVVSVMYTCTFLYFLVLRRCAHYDNYDNYAGKMKRLQSQVER